MQLNGYVQSEESRCMPAVIMILLAHYFSKQAYFQVRLTHSRGKNDFHVDNTRAGGTTSFNNTIYNCVYHLFKRFF